MASEKDTNLDDELDDLCLKILDLMNDSIRCKMDIERAVSSGCLDLAKTRYIQGSINSVSAMKIPTEDLTAATTVFPSKDGETPRYELCRENSGKGLDSNGKSANQDPIKWFGFLVPTSLRQGQSWFNKAIELSVQGANIAVELNTLVNTYENLKSGEKSLKTEEVNGEQSLAVA